MASEKAPSWADQWGAGGIGAIGDYDNQTELIKEKNGNKPTTFSEATIERAKKLINFVGNDINDESPMDINDGSPKTYFNNIFPEPACYLSMLSTKHIKRTYFAPIESIVQMNGLSSSPKPAITVKENLPTGLDKEKSFSLVTARYVTTGIPRKMMNNNTQKTCMLEMQLAKMQVSLKNLQNGIAD
ncbi:hypothetical protein Ccrd_020641 [Cynara cardunculus var. scolymus]|uniref:Uncharacterized protein n=1 Tax=Cynara cardunculus var. scolymus TaxID=59895 RepID=A0A103Y228_CYNCS|nr:hypothetical protein Ccrd_020641 [Cynara cardunculus var. scolymus]